MTDESDLLLARARQILSAGGSVEEVLGSLRAMGASMMDCVRVLRDAASLPVRDAQRAVHDSPVWADLRTSHERLQDDFFDALEQLGRDSRDRSEEET